MEASTASLRFDLTRCPCSLLDLHEAFLQGTDGCHLYDWDSDISAFDLVPLTEEVASQPDLQSTDERHSNSKRRRVDAVSHQHPEDLKEADQGVQAYVCDVPGSHSGKPSTPRLGTVMASSRHSNDDKLKSRSRKRGAGSLKARPRRGVYNPSAGDSVSAKHMKRIFGLAHRALSTSDVVKTPFFGISNPDLAVSTGWSGKPLAKAKREEIVRMYKSGKIYNVLRLFLPVYYDSANPRPAILVDRDNRIFLYRTTQVGWMAQLSDDFHNETNLLLKEVMQSSVEAAKHQGGSRGPHFPCIIGHYRAYSKRPTLTAWHKNHEEAVGRYIESLVIKRITGFISSIVRIIFPGVAQRFRTSAEWHKEMYGIEPLFGLYWNLCVNAMFKGQHRIHCLPHSDSKNIVGVCALVVYQTPGKNFNHCKRTWLVIWEAGVVIQMPPWIAVLYPSSLLYHFNIDIDDIQFVTTTGDLRPTPENSQPISEGDNEGRGSLVLFNQATMYQSSETGFESLAEAKCHGMSGMTDYGKDVQKAFMTTGARVDLGPGNAF